jgi:hypothetical protein
MFRGMLNYVTVKSGTCFVLRHDGAKEPELGDGYVIIFAPLVILLCE